MRTHLYFGTDVWFTGRRLVLHLVRCIRSSLRRLGPLVLKQLGRAHAVLRIEASQLLGSRRCVAVLWSDLIESHGHLVVIVRIRILQLRLSNALRVLHGVTLEVVLFVFRDELFHAGQLTRLVELVPEALSRLVNCDASSHFLLRFVYLQVEDLLHELVLFTF